MLLEPLWRISSESLVSCEKLPIQAEGEGTAREAKNGSLSRHTKGLEDECWSTGGWYVLEDV
jgi:hypothetical protein